MSDSTSNYLKQELSMYEAQVEQAHAAYEQVMRAAFRNPERAMKGFEHDMRRNRKSALRGVMSEKLGDRWRHGAWKGSRLSLSTAKRQEYQDAKASLALLPSLMEESRDVLKRYNYTKSALEKRQGRADNTANKNSNERQGNTYLKRDENPIRCVYGSEENTQSRARGRQR